MKNNKHTTFQNDWSRTNNVFRERASCKCLHICRIMKQLMVWGSVTVEYTAQISFSCACWEGWSLGRLQLLQCWTCPAHYIHAKDMLSPCFSQTMTENSRETPVGQLPDSFLHTQLLQAAPTGASMCPPAWQSWTQPASSLWGLRMSALHHSL